MSVAGGFAEARYAGQQAAQEAKIEQEQLKIEMENERIKGMGDINDRLEEFRKAEAQNRAALSISGIDQNWSYREGILPGNYDVIKRDVGRLGFNAEQVVSRKKYEIEVAGWKAKATKKSAMVSAGANAIKQIGEFASSNLTSIGSGMAPK
jgi:hypothetical protein